MFVVGIYGGLASQMNQYSFLYLLKRRFPNVDVRMAIGADWRRYMEHNGYELDRVFGIPRDGVEWNVVRRLANFYPGHGLKAKMFNAAFRIRDWFGGAKDTQITSLPGSMPDWRMLDVDPQKDVLFWSNYAMGFFDEIKDELRGVFTFKPPLEGHNAELMELIRRTDSVSVHVRRGDYVKYKRDMLGVEYYKNAFSRIKEQVASPEFFVFSDDPDWAEANLGFMGAKEIVRGNLGLASYVDLQLMAECKHNIIANSGYSLFASWLNRNPCKIVISPNDEPNGAGR